MVLGCVVDENCNVKFEKQQIEGSTYQLKDETYHATDGREFLIYKGKPFIIQYPNKLNPVHFKKGEQKNETYGQKLIMARMIKDTIKAKAKANIGFIILLAIGGLIGIQYFMGG